MNTIIPILRQSALTPSAPALIHGSTTVSYEQLRSFVAFIAYGLHKGGVRMGDRVVLAGASPIQEVLVCIACAWLGAASAPLPARPGEEFYEESARRVGATASVMCTFDGVTPNAPECVPENRRFLFDALYERPPEGSQAPEIAHDVDDVLWRIGFSSGTTATPKAIGWSHRASLHNSIQLQALFPSGTGERMVLAMGVSLLFSGNYWARLLHCGGCVIFPTDITAPTVMKTVTEQKATQLIASSHLASGLALFVSRRMPGTARVTPDSLRLVIAGGGPVSAPTRRIIRERICPALFINYGASETGFLGRADPVLQDKAPHITARLGLAVEAQAMDDDDRPLPFGQAGRLRFRGYAMATEYIGDPEATARQFKNGWFYPGDIGIVTMNGFVQLLGREDARLNLGGHKVDPELVEGVLNDHPMVEESVCFVASPPTGGPEVLAAGIVAREGAALESFSGELRALCEQRLGKMNTPLLYVTTKSIPRNDNGKIMRQNLNVQIGQDVSQ